MPCKNSWWCGANNSAVDASLESFRKGAEVTTVIKDSEIGKRVKYWVRPDISEPR
ncbi:MAG: NAD(P)-binding domain-containing protein [Puia sp.]